MAAGAAQGALTPHTKKTRGGTSRSTSREAFLSIRQKQRSVTTRQHVLLLVPLAALLLPFLFGPAVFGLVSTLTDYAPAQNSLHVVGLQNFAAVLADDQLRAAFGNIALIVLIVVPSALGAGLAVAYALRVPFRGRGLTRIVLLIPWLVSPIAVGVMWHFLYGPAGMLPYLAAWFYLPHAPSPLALPRWALAAVIATEVWRKAPLASFLLLPGILAIPSDLWEQAVLDGTPFRSRIRHIVLPQLGPLLLTVALLLTGDTLGMFDSVLMMTEGGPGSATQTPALYSFQKAFRAYNWPFGVVSAWLVVGTVILLGIGYLALLRPREQG
jgi:multiple sugar transport system permease protein